jgi:hypothetical protein
MQMLAFFVLWIVFWLGTPLILHVMFSSNAYPLVSIGAVISFVGGALLSAVLTGLFKDNTSLHQSAATRSALRTKQDSDIRP